MKKRIILIPAGIVFSLLVFAVITLNVLSQALVYIPAVYDKAAIQKKLDGDSAIKEVFVEKDGETLHGYCIRNNEAKNAPWVLFFGGQGDEASRYIDTFRKMNYGNFVMFNYRSYGLSSGTPSETILFDDAETVFHYVRNNYMGPDSNVYFVGFSLGSGVAVYLSTKYQPQALLLAAPYDSVRSVAGDYFPEFITTVFLHEDFDSLSRINTINCPLYIFATPGDTVIRSRHTQTLYTAANEPKQFFTVPDARHWEIIPSPEFVAAAEKIIR